MRDAGYTKWDAHTPFPVHGLDKAMGLKASRLPWVVLVCGLTGAVGGMLLQYWVAVHAYPLIISGKPLFSWPAFVPVTFEMTILVAAFAAVLGMLGLNGLPRPHHPLFAMPNFYRASRDRFFLCIESRDEKFDAESVRQLLSTTGAKEISDVPAL